MEGKKRKLAFVLLDLFGVNLSLILALVIRYDGIIPMLYQENLLAMCLIASAIAVSCFGVFQLYSSLWKYASLSEMVMIQASSLLSCLITFICFSVLAYKLPFSFYVLYVFMLITLIGTNRIAYRILRRLKSILHNIILKEYKKVLVVGAGEAGAMVIKELQTHPEMKLRPVCVIDDDINKHKSMIKGVRILGDRHSIPSLVKNMNIDEIIIAIPSAPKKEISKILDICKKTKCKLRTLPGIYELIDGNVTINNIRDVEIEDLLGREPVKVDLDEIARYLRNEVVLVTGGGGSIGSELCRQIAQQQPKKLLILDIYENGAYDLQQELKRMYPDLDQEVIIASVRERARLESIFDKYRPGMVFHAAAHKHVPLMEKNPTEAVKNNVFGTLNTAECADKYGTKRFVLISTDKAVNPTNIMGATKRIAEMIIQAMDKHSKTEFAAVRFGNVLGSNGSVIPLFKKQIKQGGPITVTHPEINRYFMTIPEAVQLVIQAGAMAKGGEIFILDMGEPVKIVDLARDLIRLSGLEPDVDIEIKFIGLRSGEKLYEELLLEEEGLTATKHDKIFIGKPTSIDLKELKRELDTLRFTIQGNNEKMIDLVQHLVPNYKRVI